MTLFKKHKTFQFLCSLFAICQL
jgi:hypothetical protein